LATGPSDDPQPERRRDNAAEDAAVAKVTESGFDPGDVKGKKLLVAHLARRHGEFTMGAPGDMAGDFHIVRLVSQNNPGCAAFHETFDDAGVGRISASECMRPQGEDIAKLRDRRRRGRWGERTPLDGINFIAKNDLIDFFDCKAGDLDRRVSKDELFKLDLERFDIPFALLGEPVGREAKQPLFRFRKVGNPNARRPVKPQMPRSLEARFAIDEFVVSSDEERIAETEGSDGGRDFPNMSWVEPTKLPR
jgi:hypothetical protein